VSPACARLAWVRSIAAAGLAAGMLLSLRLWISTRLYPLTPVLPFLRPLPSPWDRVLLFATVAFAAAALWPGLRRPATAGLIGTALLLAIGDQSRWQPWFYQYLLMFGAIFFAEARALDVCRLLVVCTYFWSGLQKLNPGFPVNIFPALVDPLARVFPRLHPAIPALGIATALAEAAIGVGLLWRRTRRVSVIAAIAMHVLLLAELGPLGRNFNQVVWPWNVSMILFDVILFWRADFRIADPWRRAGAYGKLVVLLAVVMPAFSLFGLWDSYLSFALYAGNMKTGIIYMTDAMADRLPDDLQDIIYVTSKLGIDELDENDWSYAAVGTPAYSQDRIFRSAARALCRYEQNPRELTLVVEGRRQFIGQPSHAVYSCSDLR